VCSSDLLLSMMIAIVKYASTTVPTGEIMFARSFFALIPLLIMAFMQGKIRDCVVTQRPWRHFVRSIVGVSAMTCWFTALSLIPLPEATAISFCAPLLIVVLSAIFLKENVRIYRWTAVCIGFIGVLIILVTIPVQIVIRRIHNTSRQQRDFPIAVGQRSA